MSTQAAAPTRPAQFDCGNVTEIPQTECEALVALYESTDGDNWNDNTGWLATNTPCSWFGVTCGDGNVTRLNLSNNQLSGPLPPKIGNLAALTRLGLWDNQLSGPLPPEIGNLAALTYLSLGSNQLSDSIPPEIGNLAALTSLTLSDNQLSGPLPPEIGNLAALTYLRLERNQLSGPLPPEIGNLAALTRVLYLFSNQLSGEIPPELGDLSSLADLRLSSNQLSGEIPPELGDLAALTTLDLSRNQLSGPLPPEISNLAALTYLGLWDNQLSGPLPPEIGNLTALTYLSLHDNQLSGEIPPEIGNLAVLTNLTLSDNQLSGEIPPEIGNLAVLTNLTLSDNQLSGEIPPEIGNLAVLKYLNLHNNQLSGALPEALTSLTQLYSFRFYDTDLCVPPAGAVPEWLASIFLVWGTGLICFDDCTTVTQIPQTECEALVALYESTDGDNWIENSGWLATNTPCSWYGLTCEAGNVTQISLTQNQLTGPLSPEIGNLTVLTRLNLHTNQLSGALPTALTALTRLNEFYFYDTDLCVPPTGAVPDWLAGIAEVQGTGLICEGNFFDLIASPASVPADGASQATLTLSGAPPNRRIRLFSDRSGTDTIAPSFGMTDHEGAFVATIKSSTPGNARIFARDLTAQENVPVSARVEFTGGAITYPSTDAPMDIVAVEAKLPLDARYFQGLDAVNRIAITVDWKGNTPGNIEYLVNDRASSVHATYRGGTIPGFNMSEQLQPGINTLSFVAVNAQGERSQPVTFSPRLMARPDWLQALHVANMLGEIVFASAEESSHFNIPKDPMQIRGGPLELQTEIGGSAKLSLRCEEAATLSAYGELELEAELKSITLGGKVDAEGEIVAAAVDCWIPNAEGNVKVKVTVYGQKDWPVPVFVAEFINPAASNALEKLVGVVGIGGKGLEAFGTVYVRGELSGFIESGVEIIPQDPYVEWKNYTVGFGVKPEAGYEFNSFGAEFKAYLALSGKAEQTIPFIRDFSLNKWDEFSVGGEAGYEFKPPLRSCKYERVFEIDWVYDTQEDEWTQLAELKLSRDCNIFGRQYAQNYAIFEAAPRSMQAFVLQPRLQGRAASGLAAQTTLTSVLVSNVYTYTEPALAVSADDEALLLWVHDDVDKQADQSQELYFSRWDGDNWSTPSGLTDDTLMDGMPQVAWMDTDQAVAVWSRLNEELPLGAGWGVTTARKIEIATAVYSSTTGAWSPVTLLTSNDALDLKPRLARNGDGNLLAAWRRNFTGMLGGDANNPDHIVVAFYNGDWSTPTMAVADIPGLSNLAVGYGDRSATLAYTHYLTPTGHSTSSLQLFTAEWDGASWLTSTQRTDDALGHRNPQVVYNAANQPLLVWQAGEELRLHNLATDESAALQFDIQATIDTFYVVQDAAGNLAAVFTAQGLQRDIYLAFYDQTHALWGRPRALTQDTAAEAYPSAGLDSTGRLLMSYASTAMYSITRTKTLSGTDDIITYTVPADGQTDLVTLSHVFNRNLTLRDGDLTVSDAYPAPGDTVVLSATVSNNGDLALDNVSVAFYHGDPILSGTPIATRTLEAPLAAGFTATLTTPYPVPISGTVRPLYALADPADVISEVNESDNIAILEVFGPDLEISTADVDYWGGQDVGLQTVIRNLGASTAPTSTVNFYRDALTGTLVTTDTVPALAAGAAVTLTTPWNFGDLDMGAYALVAAVNQDDFAETVMPNNLYTFTLDVRPDLMVNPYYVWTTPLTATNFVVTATVFNVGPITATNVSVAVYDNSSLLDTNVLFTATVQELGPRQTAIISQSLPALVACRVYVLVDPDNTLTETTRLNNFTSGEVANGMCSNFQATPTEGAAPLHVGFADTSSGEVSSWHWEFGDGNTSDSQHPSHTYATPDAYTVTLTVGTGIVTDTLTRQNYIQVNLCQPLTDVGIKGPLDITGSLYIDDLYTFQAVITPTEASLPITYTWTHDPVTGQGEEQATYRWSTPDTHTVTLKVENCGDPVTTTREIRIWETDRSFIYLPLVMRQH